MTIFILNKGVIVWKKQLEKSAIVKYISNNKDFIDAYGIYFKVWKKEGRFAYLESLKNTIGKCFVPCDNCDIVNI